MPIKSIKIYLLLLFSIILLPSCGLKPLYSTAASNNINTALNSIKIQPIPSIEGAKLYSSFCHLMPLTENPKYLLSIRFSFIKKPQVIEKNSDVFMELITQNIYYELQKINNSQPLTSGNFNLSVSHNCSFSPYKTYIGGDATNKMLSVAAAHQIRNRLILFFQTYKE